MDRLLREFEVSRATMKRDLEYMRERLNAPLIFDRDREGYRYDLEKAGRERYDLPGVWFSPGEIHALFVVHGLLSGIGPGLLDMSVAPLIARIEKLLESSKLPTKDLKRRVRLLNIGHRKPAPEHLSRAAQAVLQRQRLQMTHRHRGEDRLTARTVSPQRLLFYRGNWYLDAWCHLREGLRSFSLDAIEQLDLKEDPAKDIPDAELDSFYADSYGIFNGAATETAVLRFSPERARWVRNEQWHPEQRGVLEVEGTYRLEVPYGNHTELLMDILRHGSAVEVLQPEALRRAVRDEMARAIDRYR